MPEKECEAAGLMLSRKALDKKADPKEAAESVWKASYYYLLAENFGKANGLFKWLSKNAGKAEGLGASDSQLGTFKYLASLNKSSIRQFTSFCVDQSPHILFAKTHDKEKNGAAITLEKAGLDHSAISRISDYILPHCHDFLKAIDLKKGNKHSCSLCTAKP